MQEVVALNRNEKDSLSTVVCTGSPGGGLPSGLITGRHVIRKICKSEKKKFVTVQDSQDE
jgi:hypothetical protein